LTTPSSGLSAPPVTTQYSVFAVDLEEWDRTKLVTQLRRLIDEKADDVRFYLVPAEARGAWQGPVPASALFSVSGAPAATLARRLARQEGLRSAEATEGSVSV
jgi:hypothetical protein